MHIATCTLVHAHCYMHIATCTLLHAHCYMRIATCTLLHAHCYMHIVTCTLLHIYIDLSKAFDTLDHSILFAKLTYYGICGVENLMFHTYPSNIYQYVEYNGSKSETKSILIDVPKVLFWDLYFSLYTLMTYLGSVVSSVC